MFSLFRKFLQITPLGIFFIANRMEGMMYATKALLLSTLLCLLLELLLWRKIESKQLFSAAVLFIFGTITIYSNNTTFIKMKPTFIYTAFAIVFFIDGCWGKLWYKKMMSSVLEMPDHRWRQVAFWWAIFFGALAATNELIWRNCSEELWVKFKVFGTGPLVVLFTIWQMWYLRKHIKK